MSPFKLLSVLLTYPTAELQQAVPQEILPLIQAEFPEWTEKLQPLFNHLTQQDLIDVQEQYVATFDRNPNHSLHLFEHLHGESRDRGGAMVNLLQEYQKQGYEPEGYELPDYLPLFLEFLSVQPQAAALDMLGEAVHVINYLADQLANHDSVYAAVLQLVCSLSPVKPEPLKVAPVRDMDEALEVFGPTPEGVEPLLKPHDVQVVRQIRPSSGM